MKRLGIPEKRISKRLNIDRKTISDFPDMIQSIKHDLKKGVSISEISSKMKFPEPLIWGIALEKMTDQERFKALNWGLHTWDQWNWNDVDHRFGDQWPGRIPAQLVAHTLFYYTKEGQLIFDPMAGGGVVPDTCLAFNRKCWSFDLVDRVDHRPEIEVHQWKSPHMKWPVKSKEKPDLIFIDPPYFKKMDHQYSEGSISRLSKREYLEFFSHFLSLAYENSKTTTRLAFLNADWRNYQSIPTYEENENESILMPDYFDILRDTGWNIAQLTDCPLSTQRLNAGVVSQMQKKRIFGVTRRTLIMCKRKCCA
jgi:hypothetical protein